MATKGKRMRVTAWSYYALRAQWPDAVCIRQNGMKWEGYVFSK